MAAIKVYISGGNVIVEQSGTTTLTILQERAKYTVLQPTLSVDGISSPTAESISFVDIFLDDVRTGLILEVQNSTGGTYSTLKDLQKYLLFIPRAETTYITKQAATAENQTTIITQNEQIEFNTGVAKDELQDLDKIKELLKDNNKQLKKINN